MLRLAKAFILATALACAAATALSETPSRAEMEKFAKLVWKAKEDKLAAFMAANPGFDVDAPMSEATGQSPIFAMVYNGRIESVAWLLANGQDVNQQDASGATPLYIAAGSPKKKESLKIAAMLLDAGADHTIALTSSSSPFQRAVIFGRTDLMDLLLSRGADPMAVTSDGAGALDALDWSCREGTLKYMKQTDQCPDIQARLEALGIKRTATYKPSQLAEATTAAGAAENQEILDREAQKISDRIDLVTDALFAKAKGTGRRCFHQLMIGNFTGSDLKMSMSIQLDDGRWTEVSESQDGHFTISNSRTHPMWLVQGGTYMLGAQSSKGGSWFDGIRFDVPADCKDGDRDVTLRQFIVENDNQTSRLSMFEDTDRDGRRDTVAAAQPASPAAPDACAGLIPLATELSADSSSLMFADDQLDQMLTSAGCTLPEQIRNQRRKLVDLLQKTTP